MAATLQTSNAGSPSLKTSFDASSTRTIPFTVPAGDDQVLVVKWAGDKWENFLGSPAPAPVWTWNGVAMTVAGTSAGVTVNKIQIAYLKGPAQGTHNLQLVTGDQHNLGTITIEVWSDVDQADTPVFTTSEATNVTSWTSGAAVPAGYVCTSGITGNFAAAAVAGGTTSILGNQPTYSGDNASFGYRVAGQPGWTWTGAAQVAGASLVLKDAVQSELSGNVTQDDVVAAGELGSSNSDLGGNVTLDNAAAAGALGMQPGTCTVPELDNGVGLLLVSEVVPIVTALRLTDGVQVMVMQNLAAHATTGDLVVQHAALVPGTWYVMAGFNADGTKRFILPVQAQ